MSERKARLPWRAAFLRALAQGASVTRAAAAAGIDKTSAYAARKRHPDLAAAWAAAVEEGRARLAAGEMPVLAADESVRASRHGRPCVMRVGPGRWSSAKERAFLAELAATANVRAAARAVGISTEAVYERRRKWPGFAERWAAALAEGYARLEAHLVRAASDTFDSEPVAAARERPAVSFADGLNLLRLHKAGAAATRARGRVPAEVPIEEVRVEVLRRVRAMGVGGERMEDGPSAYAQ